MKGEKIINLLGYKSGVKLPRFITKKWTEFYHESAGIYSPNRDIRFKTQELRSDLTGWNIASLIIKDIIDVTEPNVAAYDKKIAIGNFALLVLALLEGTIF